MNNHPIVSVVIPAYNSSEYISDAIDSVLKQNVDLEIVVVNDCSTDGLDAVMEKYSDEKRVLYLKNKINLGVAKSRNKGIEIAKGEYVAFLDADDYWEEEKLSKQLELINNSDYVLCATARKLFGTEGRLNGLIIPVNEEITYNDLLKHNSISCSSVLVRTKVAKEFLMHNDECHEDYIMWLEILRKYNKACGINEPLLNYRISSKGKSGSKLKSAKMTFMVYRKIGLSYPKALKCFISYAFNGVKKYLGK